MVRWWGLAPCRGPKEERPDPAARLKAPQRDSNGDNRCVTKSVDDIRFPANIYHIFPVKISRSNLWNMTGDELQTVADPRRFFMPTAGFHTCMDSENLKHKRRTLIPEDLRFASIEPLPPPAAIPMSTCSHRWLWQITKLSLKRFNVVYSRFNCITWAGLSFTMAVGMAWVSLECRNREWMHHVFSGLVLTAAWVQEERKSNKDLQN